MSVGKFMEGRAVDLRTGGRYSLASRRDLQGNRREFACRTTRISPFQMLVAAPVVGPIGERVITFFGELGKLDGWISDVVENGFLVDIALTKKVRERLAKKLVWLEKKQKEAVVDVRGQQRVAPENPHTNLIFGDGTTVSCFVIDVSPSGAAVSADIDTEIAVTPTPPAQQFSPPPGAPPAPTPTVAPTQTLFTITPSPGVAPTPAPTPTP